MVTGGLAAWQQRRALELLSENLEGPFRLSDLARECAQFRALIRRAGREHLEVPMMLNEAMARALLSPAFDFKPNRDISRARLDQLEVIINEGRFKKVEPMRFDWDGAFRDGRHRCLAIIRTGIPQLVLMHFGMDPDDFFAIDMGLRRNAAQSMQILGVKYPHIVAALVRPLPSATM